MADSDRRPPLRLRHRRRRLGRLRARQPAQRRPDGHGSRWSRPARSDRKLEIKIPAGVPEAVPHQVRLGPVHGVPARAEGPRAVLAARASTLGGSSSLNAQMWVRGAARRLRRVGRPRRRAGRTTTCCPTSSARRTGSAATTGDVYGTGGPLYIEELRDPNPLRAAFFEACAQDGFTRLDELNVPGIDGYAPTPVTQHRGRRWSAADGYLRPARKRAEPDGVRRRAQREGRGVRRARRAACASGWRKGRSPDADRRPRGARLRRRRPLPAPAAAVGHRRPRRCWRAAGITAHRRERVGRQGTAGPPVRPGHHVHPRARHPGRRREAGQPAQVPGPAPRHAHVQRRRGRALRPLGAELAHPDLEYIFAPVPFIEHGQDEPTGTASRSVWSCCSPKSSGTVTARSADPTVAPIIDAGYLTRAAGTSSVSSRGVQTGPATLRHQCPARPGDGAAMMPAPDADRPGRVRPQPAPRRCTTRPAPAGWARDDGVRRRRVVAGARGRRPARRRRVGDAADHPRAHARADGHDRREGGRADPLGLIGRSARRRRRRTTGRRPVTAAAAGGLRDVELLDERRVARRRRRPGSIELGGTCDASCATGCARRSSWCAVASSTKGRCELRAARSGAALAGALGCAGAATGSLVDGVAASRRRRPTGAEQVDHRADDAEHHQPRQRSAAPPASGLGSRSGLARQRTGTGTTGGTGGHRRPPAAARWCSTPRRPAGTARQEGRRRGGRPRPARPAGSVAARSLPRQGLRAPAVAVGRGRRRVQRGHRGQQLRPRRRQVGRDVRGAAEPGRHRLEHRARRSCAGRSATR